MIPQLFSVTSEYVAVCRFDDYQSVGMIVTFGIVIIAAKAMLTDTVQ
jgi:hypothetical protein